MQAASENDVTQSKAAKEARTNKDVAAVEVPHTFARRAKPQSSSGLEKYSRIVNAFKSHIKPLLKPRARTSAEDCVCQLTQA